MKAMEHALCLGTPATTVSASTTDTSVSKESEQPAEFWRPMDAALHLGTPHPLPSDQEKSVSTGANWPNPNFFD